MDTLKKIVKRIAYPGRFRSMLIVLSGFGLLDYIYVTRQSTSFLAYAAYVLSDYALLILAANSIPAFCKIRRRLEANLYARRWLSEPEYRARISLYAGLLIDFVYIVFKAVLGIYYRSVWYGAVAVYYVVLSAVRFFLVQNDRRSPEVVQALRCYRLAGLSMLFLNMAMAGMMIQMIGYGRGGSYPGFVIYASAAYTFYIVITAVINAIKFHKRGYDPILSATKMLSFAAALMSLFALQTAMLTQFGTDSRFNRLMNTAAGAGVTVLTVGISVFMVFRGNRALKEAGAAFDVYTQYRADVYGAEADKDADGNSISGSKKEKVLNFIDRMDISDEDKDKLYLSAGYTEKALGQTPWRTS